MAPRVRAGSALPGGPADVRLALKEALAALATPDLQQQSVFAVEALLRDAEAPTLDCFLREAFRLGDCPSGSVRRLRYKLAGQALRLYGSAQGEGGSLLAVRDLLLGRVGLEDNGAAAAELAALAGQLAAACIDAYCQERYSALGQAGKGGLQRSWLSELLLAPLLRAACKGPARTRVANASLMVHGVLLELRRWAKSAGVLHAAVDCLKLMLKLSSTGALPLSAGEALLPVQSCIALLGPRLKSAALDGILQLCTQGMQRGEWQVRKAAADTLAGLVEALLASEVAAAAAPAPAAQQQQQQQGLAALESVAQAMAQAVEQHIKYDRMPAVRQAAAAVLHLLQRVPSMRQQEQQPPAHQLQRAGTRTSAAGAQADAPAAGNAAVAGPAPAPAASLALGRSRGDLKAVIAERRRQLLQGSWEQPAAGVDKLGGGGQGGSQAKRQERASADTSVGSAEGGSIPAWPAAGVEQPAGSNPAAEAAALAACPTAQAGGKPAVSRPPSVQAFAVAAAAMDRLHPVQDRQQQLVSGAGRRRRGWGSLPTSPAKRGTYAASGARASRDLPVQVFLPRSPPPARVACSSSLPAAASGAAPSAEMEAQQQEQGERSMWRVNPLAQSAEGPPTAAPPAAAASLAHAPPAVSCVHHIEHPEFTLRLQSVPPNAELLLSDPDSSSSGGGASAPVLRGVRLWVHAEGADVGLELRLSSAARGGVSGGTLHRYWLSNGQLHQERTTQAAVADGQHAASPSTSAAVQPPALPEEQQTPVAGVPSLPPEQQQARGSTAEQAPLAQAPPSPAAVPAESPLASLATEALPSFSPDKLGPPSAAAAGVAATPTPSAALAAAGGTPGVTAPGWRASGSPAAAGARRSSPVLQSHAAGARWASSLRHPGEQLLPGLPDWDRSRPASPGVCGSRASSRGSSPGKAGSRAASPVPSRPGSPLRNAGSGNHSPGPYDATRQLGPAEDGSANRASSPDLQSTPLQQLAAQQHGQPQLASATAQQHEEGTVEQQEGQRGEQQGPGPLTAMVTRAVSKLQQLHELEEELQLPVGVGFGPLRGPASQAEQPGRRAGPGMPAGSQRRAEQRRGQTQQQQDPRRSLEPALTAIEEEQEPESSGSTRRGGARAAQGPSMGRLQTLQQQLQLNMDELQKRIDAQHGPKEADSADASAAKHSPDTSSSDEMPAAWDEQDHGGGLVAQPVHRYAPQPPRHWRQQQQQQQQQDRGPAGAAQAEGQWTAAASAAHRFGHGQEPQASSPARSDESFSWRQPGGGGMSPADEGDQEPAADAGGADALMVAVNNPLFGMSRPGTAQSVHGMHDMLPPKRSLVARRRRSPPQAGAGSTGGSPGHERQLGHREERQRQSAQMSIGPTQSLGSLGSGFSALRKESEAEVQHFLRGSLAAPQQLPRQAPAASCQPAAPPLASSPPAGIQAPAQQAGPARSGSLDLSAILDSRPASPHRLNGVSSTSSSSLGDAGPPWQTSRSRQASGVARWRAAEEQQPHRRSQALGSDLRGLWSDSSDDWAQQEGAPEQPVEEEEEEGSEVEGWPPVSPGRQQQQQQQVGGPGDALGGPTAELQLLRVSSRCPSPAAPGRAVSGSGAGSSALAEVARQTYPAGALQQLEQLKLRLSATSRQREQRHEHVREHGASPGGTTSGRGSPRHDAWASSSAGGSSHGASGEGASPQSSPTVDLPLRDWSPELPGLHLSRRQARVLQSAVGRMAGNPGESADAEDIQAALQDVLVAQTAHVQAHYRRAAAEQLGVLRHQRGAASPLRRHGDLQRQAAALEAAQEAATRRELEAFIQETLPRLAEVLTSRSKLLRCFEAAAEPGDGDSTDEE